MKYLSIEERKQIADTLRSQAKALQELAKQLEKREQIIDTNCALGAVSYLIKRQSEKLNTASEREYEAKKLINIL